MEASQQTQAQPAAKKGGATLAGLVGGVAAVVSIIAGIYLFQTESASEDVTVFDALFKAMGAYFVARGLWMISRLEGIRSAG